MVFCCVVCMSQAGRTPFHIAVDCMRSKKWNLSQSILAEEEMRIGLCGSDIAHPYLYVISHLPKKCNVTRDRDTTGDTTGDIAEGLIGKQITPLNILIINHRFTIGPSRHPNSHFYHHPPTHSTGIIYSHIYGHTIYVYQRSLRAGQG